MKGRCFMVAWVLLAWVLWEQTTVMLSAKGAEFWRIVSTHDGRQDCITDHAKHLADYRLQSTPEVGKNGIRRSLGPDYLHTQYDVTGLKFKKERLLCVPATLDPRPREKDVR